MSFRGNKYSAQGHIAKHTAKIGTMKGTLERQDHSLGNWMGGLCMCSGWVCIATPWVGTQGRGLQSHCWCFGAKNVCPLDWMEFRCRKRLGLELLLPWLTSPSDWDGFFSLSPSLPRQNGICLACPWNCLRTLNCFHECVCVCWRGIV